MTLAQQARGEWRKLPISLSELCIATVLRCGQSFRWRLSGPDEWFTLSALFGHCIYTDHFSRSCALKGRILSLRQDKSHLHYRSIYPAGIARPNGNGDDTPALIHDYFNLSIELGELYQTWSSRDPNFQKKAASFAGVRMLRQDPWENVVSFICSSNNNISRISQMVNNLCLTWGPLLGTLDGGEGTSGVYHDFPTPIVLTKPGVEQKLRELGFGYRAKYIAKAAKMIVEERPEGWLDSLRTASYSEAHAALLELPGVGPKVADCVALMSLDKADAVPVDTHGLLTAPSGGNEGSKLIMACETTVLQIAQRDYGFGKTKNKTLTKTTYDAIGDHFRALWGDEAGWAHSVCTLRPITRRPGTCT